MYSSNIYGTYDEANKRYFQQYFIHKCHGQESWAEPNRATLSPGDNKK